MKKSLARKNSPHPMMGRARSGSSNWIHLLTRSSQSTYLWVCLSCVYCTYGCQSRPVICRQKDFWILLHLLSSHTYYLWKEVLPKKNPQLSLTMQGRARSGSNNWNHLLPRGGLANWIYHSLSLCKVMCVYSECHSCLHIKW